MTGTREGAWLNRMWFSHTSPECPVNVTKNTTTRLPGLHLLLACCFFIILWVFPVFTGGSTFMWMSLHLTNYLLHYASDHLASAVDRRPLPFWRAVETLQVCPCSTRVFSDINTVTTHWWPLQKEHGRKGEIRGGHTQKTSCWGEEMFGTGAKRRGGLRTDPDSTSHLTWECLGFLPEKRVVIKRISRISKVTAQTKSVSWGEFGGFQTVNMSQSQIYPLRAADSTRTFSDPKVRTKV